MIPLTSQDIAALKKADTLVFRSNQFEVFKGKTVIDCTRKVKPKAGWTTGHPMVGDNEEQYVIEVNGHIDEKTECCASIPGQWNDHWKSIRKCIRVGDGIILSWRPDHGTSECLRKHGIHIDVLEIEIHRKAKGSADWKPAFIFDLIHDTQHYEPCRMVHARKEGF